MERHYRPKALVGKHICLASVRAAALANGSETGLQTRERLRDRMAKTLTGLYFDPEKH